MNRKLKFCTQTAVVALLFGAGTAPAMAQSDQGQIETVVVTGYRASLQNALDLKKNSNLIMESVTAEDVGKMPDQDVADSLQRLPGVQIDRFQGKGTSVLIDGLRQNSTTLNGDVFLTGKEFYVSGEASGGGSGGNSQYNSLEGIPSEEIGRVDIYKSPNAGLTEGGIGGIIDLRTRNALDSADGLSYSVQLRGTSTSNASLADTTPNATLVASYKPSSTFAVTGSISYDDEDSHTKEYESYNRSPWAISTNDATGYTGTGPLLPTDIGTLPNGVSALLPEFGYFSDVYDKDKVLGATFGANWNPSDSIQTSLNWFYSQTSEQTINYSDKVGLNGAGGSGDPLDASDPYSIDANGVVKSATFWLTGAETSTLFQHVVSDANNLQWHTAWDNGGPLTGTLDVSYARATSNLQAAQEDTEHGYYHANAGTGSAATNAPGCNNYAASCTSGNPAYAVAWTNGGTSGLPTAQAQAPYADVLSNPAYALFKSGWAWANETKQTQQAVRGELVWKPDFLSDYSGSITGGFRFANRDVSQIFGRYMENSVGQPTALSSSCCTGPTSGTWLYYMDPGYADIPYATPVTLPSQALTVHNFALGNILVKNPYTSGMTNPATFLNTIWNTATNLNGATQPNNSEKFFKDTLSSFNVTEFTEAGYLMADLGSKDKGYHLNVGVRVVRTTLTIDGAQTAEVPAYIGTTSWNGVNANNVPVTTNRHYVDVLPSLNLEVNLTDEQILRFGAAKVVSPQDLFSLGLGNSYNFTRGAGCAKGSTVTTGTPGTTPGCNIGYEFATGSAGNPKLDPYRANQFNFAWEDYFAPGGLASAGVFYKQVKNFVETENLTEVVMDDFGGTAGSVSTPVNAGGGSIKGIEVAGQYAFDNGFGVAANYTFSQSTSGQVTAFTNHAEIPGVSHDAVTGTVYYEKYGFDTRLSYSWRDKAVNDGLGGSTFSVKDFTNGGAPKVFGVFTAPYGELDAQVSYAFNDHISVLVSAQNLADAVYHTYLQYPNMPFTYDDSGTRYFFGVRYKN